MTRTGSDEPLPNGQFTRRVSTANSRAAQRHVDQALLALREGKRDRAVALLDAAISLDPDNQILVANRDRLLAGRGRER